MEPSASLIVMYLEHVLKINYIENLSALTEAESAQYLCYLIFIVTQHKDTSVSSELRNLI